MPRLSPSARRRFGVLALDNGCRGTAVSKGNAKRGASRPGYSRRRREVTPVQTQSRREGARRRPRPAETPAAPYARRLRPLARMREWYARHAAARAATTDEE